MPDEKKPINIKQIILDSGLNVFGAQLLGESLLHHSNPQKVAFPLPIVREDCPGWIGVRMVLEPVKEGEKLWTDSTLSYADLAAKVEHLEGAVIEMCDLGHKFVKLPDHPKRDGLSRCPYCMAEGLDKLREKLEKVHHFETPIPSLMPDLPNANGRIYPKGVIEKAVADYQERIKEKTALVYVEPKDPGRPQFAEAGGIITELTVEDGVVFAKGHAIDTPAGGIFKELLDVKRFDLTPCGTGSEEKDRKVEDGYELNHFSVSMGGLPPCSMGFKEMPEEDEGEKEERDENSD